MRDSKKYNCDRTSRITMRVSESEKALIFSVKKGLSISDWCLRMAKQKQMKGGSSEEKNDSSREVD